MAARTARTTKTKTLGKAKTVRDAVQLLLSQGTAQGKILSTLTKLNTKVLREARSAHTDFEAYVTSIVETFGPALAAGKVEAPEYMRGKAALSKAPAAATKPAKKPAKRAAAKPSKRSAAARKSVTQAKPAKKAAVAAVVKKAAKPARGAKKSAASKPKAGGTKLEQIRRTREEHAAARGR